VAEHGTMQNINSFCVVHTGGETTTATLTETSASADQHQNTSQPDYQFRVPEVPLMRVNSNVNRTNYLMAGTSSLGGGVRRTGDAIITLGSDAENIFDDFFRGDFLGHYKWPSYN